MVMDLKRFICAPVRASRGRNFLLMCFITCVTFSIIVIKSTYQDSKEELEIDKIMDKLSALENIVLEDRLFDYKGEMSKLNAARVAQDDPRLVKLIRDHYLLPPSTEPYSLDTPSTIDFSMGHISSEIRNALHMEQHGFFIECGAFDGEFKSTSLYFERELHWKGLLVEADPVSFARLRAKNRKAYMLNACLSTLPYPSMMKFNVLGETGRVIDHAADWYLNAIGQRTNEIHVQCFPLFSILLALNQLNIDMFTLDIEGAELDVLRTIPLDKVNISTMLVEYSHIVEGFEPVQEFLANNGYVILQKLEEDVIVIKG